MKMVIFVMFAWLMSMTSWSHAQTPAFGTLLWSNSFKTQADLDAGSGSGSLAPVLGRGSVLALVSPNAGGSATRNFILPVERLRARYISVSADVKAENVSAKPQPWNGVKLMVKIDTPAGTQWPQPQIGIGSFDWTHFASRLLIPAEATAVTLVLGLESVTGKAWFDNARITFVKSIQLAAPAPANQPIFRGHNLSRLRGAMVSPGSLTRSDLQTFADWGGNLIRWQLIRSNMPDDQNIPEAYDRWLDDQLHRLDQGLDWARSMGIMVVVDLHSPPGGKNSAGGYQAAMGGIFSDPRAQSRFVDVWKKITNRYKGEKQIWGFDLVNEPVDDTASDGCDDWQGLALRAGRAVQEIDPARVLIVECPSWGSPDGFTGFQPIPLPHVVYSVHMYNPGEFTHQGVFSPSVPVQYPGKISGVVWDKSALEKSLAPAIQFAKRYRVNMYVGEFSAIRWAPGGERYLSDLIDIFEENGWDWSYHAYREWSGWSVEHSDVKGEEQPTTTPTARKLLLQRWFKQNQRAKQ